MLDLASFDSVNIILVIDYKLVDADLVVVAVSMDAELGVVPAVDIVRTVHASAPPAITSEHDETFGDVRSNERLGRVVCFIGHFAAP
jgi:hypothetical protein